MAAAAAAVVAAVAVMMESIPMVRGGVAGGAALQASAPGAARLVL